MTHKIKLILESCHAEKEITLDVSDSELSLFNEVLTKFDELTAECKLSITYTLIKQ